MQVLDVIKSRGSIRRYKSNPLPKDALASILEAARLSQSANNGQPWQFIIVTDPQMKKKLADAADDQDFVGESAAVVVCLANPKASFPVGPFEGFLIDLAIAIENMALTAWDLGIGSCWIGAFNEDTVKKLLGVPENLRVISLLTLGYPDERSGPKHRKSLDEIVHFGKYGHKQTSV